ncbi:16532_t:CDS:2 [Funneliformis mosseae]|uniref:16532_t:CDS:1 n=1 Tax=Funneliformis mosseae TaxID=27381 RepID=A0A9N9CXN8_FUNMO|nr:16532_t:CDS:2 [Funneliformis mosseae]
MILPELHNLKVLKSNIITDDLEHYLNTLRFQHLEVLQIDYITANVTCKKLKVLILEAYDNFDDLDAEIISDERKLVSGANILNVLINSAPINLDIIRIVYEFNFSINIFRELERSIGPFYFYIKL